MYANRDASLGLGAQIPKNSQKEHLASVGNKLLARATQINRKNNIHATANAPKGELKRLRDYRQEEMNSKGQGPQNRGNGGKSRTGAIAGGTTATEPNSDSDSEVETKSSMVKKPRRS
jgi:hypothetical protein